MYRSMDELTTCRHAQLQGVIAAVARVMPGTCWTNPSLHIAGGGTVNRSMVHSKVDLMKSPNLKKTTGELGVLLRHWRDVRGKSQLDLSLDTGVSQKQISFVESGRTLRAARR